MLSSVAWEAFVYVTNNVSEATATESAIRKLMLRCAGAREIWVQEIMHHIIGLKIYYSSFQLVAVSLDNSKQCTFSIQDIWVEKPELEIYGGVSVFGQAFKDLNLVECLVRK